LVGIINIKELVLEMDLALSSVKDKKPHFYYGYVIVAIAFLIMVIMWGTFYSFGIFFKPLLDEFGWTRAMTTGAFALSHVVLSLFSFIAGKLTDRFGPRIVVTVCGLFLGAGYLLIAQVNVIWQLYLFYGVMTGIGMGAAFIPLASTVARWFVKRRGMMTGIAASGLAVGTLVVPLLADWLIFVYGWRFSYMIVGSITLVLITLAAQFLKREPNQLRQYSYGEENSQGPIDTGVLGLSFREAVKTRQLWVFALAAFCFLWCQGTIIVHIVPHVIGIGISSSKAAVILAIIGGAGVGGRIIMGTASDKIGYKPALIICFSLLSVVLFLLTPAKELWMLYLLSAIFGFGYGGVSAVASPTTAYLFGLRSHGTILGLINMHGEGGSAIGSVVAGYIFDTTGSYQSAFLACAAASIIGISLLSLLRPITK
jgi:MFS family permease